MKLILGLGVTMIVAATASRPVQPVRAELTTTWCSSDTIQRAYQLYYFKRLVAGATDFDAHDRHGFRLPAIDSSHVSLVTTDSLCRKAAVLINRAKSLADSFPRSVVLIKIDTVYVAKDPLLLAGEFGVRFRMNAALDSIVSTVFN
jgi:hypothetical protein